MMDTLLPYLGLVIVWAALVLMLWRTRRWLVYYLTAAFGFTLLVVYGTSLVGLDNWLEHIEAQQVVAMASMFGMNIEILGQSGLAIANHVGWAVFDIGIECSAILEMAAIVGLVGFYPGFSAGQRVITGLIGLVATYVLNLLRILLIVTIINALGTEWVFAAHAVFGRVFFFVGTVALYWFLITRPTMGIVGRKLKKDDMDVGEAA